MLTTCYLGMLKDSPLVSFRVTSLALGQSYDCTGAIIWLPQCQWSNPEGYQKVPGSLQHLLYRSSSWCREQSRYIPSQWETLLQCNDISHWLGTYLDWSLFMWWPFISAQVSHPCHKIHVWCASVSVVLTCHRVDGAGRTLWLGCLFEIDSSAWGNTWRLKQNGCYFADSIFSKKKCDIFIYISLKFVLKGKGSNWWKSAFILVMAWLQKAEKPFPEPMLTMMPDAIWCISFYNNKMCPCHCEIDFQILYCGCV